jgi:hypothetical protein
MLVDVGWDIQALSTQIRCYHMYYGIKRNVVVIKTGEIHIEILLALLTS